LQDLTPQALFAELFQTLTPLFPENETQRRITQED
jgi:hypothetical protein